MFKTGSINFSQKGGICCNYNPCTHCLPNELGTLKITESAVFLGEEPGIGALYIALCLGCPYICVFVSLISLCCGPFFVCCCPPMEVRGYEFSKDTTYNKVNCALYNKHLCDEESPILYKDVVKVEVKESDRVHVDATDQTPPYLAIFEKMHIYYRDEKEGRLVEHITPVLKAVRRLYSHVGIVVCTCCTCCQYSDDIESPYKPFVDAVNELIQRVTGNIPVDAILQSFTSQPQVQHQIAPPVAQCIPMEPSYADAVPGLHTSFNPVASTPPQQAAYYGSSSSGSSSGTDGTLVEAVVIGVMNDEKSGERVSNLERLIGRGDHKSSGV